MHLLKKEDPPPRCYKTQKILKEIIKDSKAFRSAPDSNEVIKKKYR